MNNYILGIKDDYMNEDKEADFLKRMIARFKVKVENDPLLDNQIVLQVSNDGSNWNNMRFYSKKNLEQVAEAIQKYLKANKD